jgi:hypothetical protein
MNYFLANLFRDKMLWILVGLSALAGLIIMDFISYMLLGNGFFNLWIIRGTMIAAAAGLAVYAVILHRREKRERRLAALLPPFVTDRIYCYKKAVNENPGFQTLCHECRHFDPDRLRCLLFLRERKSRVRLQEDSPLRHCLYWNLGDCHPVMQLTERLEEPASRSRGTADGRRQTENEKMEKA